MVSIKIILDKRRSKKDGSYPLNFQIYSNRKTRTRYSGVSVKEECWDETNSMIKRSHNQYKILNLKLQKGLADLQSELLLADEKTVEQFFKPVDASEPFKEKSIKTVYQFAGDLIRDLKASNKIGNAWVYESTVNALRGFHPEETLTFDKIDYEFLHKYQNHLYSREIKPNSVYLYIRTIRIFYNKAIKLKLVDKSLYPFDDFKLRPEKTRKRAIDKDLIKKIKDLPLKENTTIWHVRNWFMLSFYLIGISVVDLALLTPKSYTNGRVEYKRRKTGKWYDIKVVPQAEQILMAYLKSKKVTSTYLLPIINERTESEERLMRIVKSRTKLINKYIKKLGELIEYDGQITTYTVRHSWATIAKRLGYSNEVIAEALGHEYGNETTNVYLDTFEREVVDVANLKVSQSID